MNKFLRRLPAPFSQFHWELFSSYMFSKFRPRNFLKGIAFSLFIDFSYYVMYLDAQADDIWKTEQFSSFLWAIITRSEMGKQKCTS